MSDSQLSVLSEREKEVLALIAEGLSHQEIAYRLTIDERTARGHASTIYAKLGISSRAEAMRMVVSEQLRIAEATLADLHRRIAEAQTELSHMKFYLQRSIDLITKLGEP